MVLTIVHSSLALQPCTLGLVYLIRNKTVSFWVLNVLSHQLSLVLRQYKSAKRYVLLQVKFHRCDFACLCDHLWFSACGGFYDVRGCLASCCPSAYLSFRYSANGTISFIFFTLDCCHSDARSEVPNTRFLDSSLRYSVADEPDGHKWTQQSDSEKGNRFLVTNHIN